MKKMYKKIQTFLNQHRLYLGVILIAFIGTGLVFGWLDPNEYRLSEGGIPSMKTLYPKALEVALEWQEDTYLANIWYLVRKDSEDMDVLYGFHSYVESDILVVRVIIARDGVEISSTARDLQGENLKSGEPSGDPSINMEEVSLDSIEAVSFINQNGGDDFFHKYPNGYIIMIKLDTIPDFPFPLWIVEYVDPDSFTYLQLKMNAITNEFLEPIQVDP